MKHDDNVRVLLNVAPCTAEVGCPIAEANVYGKRGNPCLVLHELHLFVDCRDDCVSHIPLVNRHIGHARNASRRFSVDFHGEVVRTVAYAHGRKFVERQREHEQHTHGDGYAFH